VDHHAGALVEDEQVPILVQHGEGDVLRDDSGGLRVRDLDDDPLVAPQPGRGLGRAAVEEHEPVGEQPLDPGTGERGGQARHGHVETDPRLALAGPELVVLGQLPVAAYLRGIVMCIARELRLDGQKVARSYLERAAGAAKPGR
jgi:hypothetical protein